MSLQVWLPLNGNLENKGIASISTTNTPIYVDGKMGNAINLTSRVKFYNLPKLTKFTITFWAKVESCTADWADLLGFTCKQADDSNAATFRFEATTSSRACSFHNNAPEGISTGSRILIRNYNEWHHVAVSYNGEKLYSYIDGSLTYTDTGLGGYLTSSFHIGESPITGAMNDLRIYDECLSKEQIHQISQGLILHYPLNSGYGNENLIIGSGKYTKNSPLVRTKNAVDGWQKESTLYTNTIEAGTYTLQAKTDGNWHNHSTPSGGYSPDLKYCSIWLVSDAANNESGKDINICLGQTVPKSIVLSYKGKYWIRTNLYSNGTDNLTINFWDFKLEKGEKCSLWSPNQADNLYSQLGYDSTIMYDTSGLENNGIINNKPTSIGGGVIGNGCLKFNGNNQYISAGRGAMVKDAITINIWAYMDNWSNFGNSNMRIVSCTQGGGWNFEPKNGYLNFAVGVGTTTNSYMADFASQIKLADISSGWHMITGTFDGINKKIYFDGILKGTVSLTTKTPIFYNSTNGIFIAAEAGNDLKVAEGNYFNGELNDFRIYSTALSAEDIKQLYESRARIDKSGNLYCNQFVEMDNERNLLDTDDYWISGQTSGTYKQEKIECSDSVSGTATKITCTAAGSGGFYMSGHKVFDKTTLINGKQYIISLYAKSDNRTSIRFNVECSSKQSKSTFTIGTEYRRICIIYTYSNTPTYNAFTSYGGWAVDENVYIHSIKVTEYNPTTYFKNNSVVETNSFIEIKSEEKCKIYKQDIQSNEIIEI